MPRAPGTRQGSYSLTVSPGIDFNKADAASSRAVSAAGIVDGGSQLRQARIASAQDSGVRKPATLFSASSFSEASACGARNTASGLSWRSASIKGCTETSGWNCDELPETASTMSQWSEASSAFNTPL